MFLDGVQHLLQVEREFAGLDDEAFGLLAEQRATLAARGGGRARDDGADPGRTSSSPSATSVATTLCAVFGLMRRSWLMARTEGKGSPGRSWPATQAFFTAKTTCS